jgi:ribosomal protein L40E
MRKLLGVLGIAIIILGVLGVFGGRVLVEWRYEGGGIVFWAGFVMVLIGWIVSSKARNKTCSSCQARVPAATHSCERCGATFG